MYVHNSIITCGSHLFYMRTTNTPTYICIFKCMYCVYEEAQIPMAVSSGICMCNTEYMYYMDVDRMPVTFNTHVSILRILGSSCKYVSVALYK